MVTEELANGFKRSLSMLDDGIVMAPAPSWAGGETVVEVDLNEDPSPALFLVQTIGISAFLGDYGLGKTVKTFTLLPGESMTISTRTWRATSDTVSEGSSIIDSYDETSRNNFAASMMNETTDSATRSKTENWHAEGEASASWGWGKAKVSGGGSGEYSSSVEEFSKAVSETVQEHAAEASSHRENTVTSSSESSRSAEDETVIERTIKNINVGCLASQINGISRRQNVRDSGARYAAGRSRNASSFAFASRAQGCHRGS